MDANVMEPDSKRKKLSKERSMDDGQDKFSKLPDNLIHHILSHIPTKDAVATSILSTRWKWMWTSVSSLEFDEGINGNDPVDKVKFVTFVDRVLNLHDETSVKKFRLRCKNHDASRVASWISVALQHKVEELDCNVSVEGPMALIVLPELICQSESLTVVRMQSNHGIVVPTALSLANLKILHLRSIVFSPALSSQTLFASCPALSELILDKCKMIGFGAIIISIPTVKTLRLDDFYRDSEMRIHAEKLTSFVYIGAMPRDLSLDNTSSLVDAYVEITQCNLRQTASRAYALLRQLSNVKFLGVSNTTTWCLFYADFFCSNLPTFRNLIHLELGTEVFPVQVRLFRALLKNSPNLEHLLLQKELRPKEHIDRERSTAGVVPGIFLSGLKLVEFKKFSASKAEVILVRILLKYAPSLEKMTILSSDEFLEDKVKRNWFKHLLLTTPSFSSRCSIYYS